MKFTVGRLRFREAFCLFLEDLGQFLDELEELAFSALGEQRELDTDGGLAVTLADGTLDAQGKLAHGKGHFDGFRSHEVVTLAKIEQAPAEAQVCYLSAAVEARGQAANLRLTGAHEPRMLSSIFSPWRHSAPFGFWS
jgi:hypothetical protein